MEPVFPFALDLSRPAAATLAGALHQQLRAAILDGRLAAGSVLPSTRKAAAALGVARNTVVVAFDLLVAEGYVQPRTAARAVVADIATRQPARPAHGALSRKIPRRWLEPGLARELPRTLPVRSFRLGMPEGGGFPHDIWRQLSARALRGFSRVPFHYPPADGLPELREAIAGHAAFSRAVACRADDVVVTSGAQQAHYLLAQLLVAPGRTRVAVEDPGYPPTRAAFAAAGAELVPVPVDDAGLRVDALPDDVEIVCVTPSHQSPSGVAMSMSRRRALLEFARRRNAVVVEDDYDGEFRFGGRPLDALQTLDRDGRVFYVGTFSKSLFPSLRKGFLVVPWARDALLNVKQVVDPHGDIVAQATLAAFIRDGHLARHVRRMHPLYAARRRALLDGLEAMTAWFEPIPAEAGLHLAARIRDAGRAQHVAALVQRHAPGAVDIGGFASLPWQPALAFGYGAIDATEITTSLRALKRALAREIPA
jgi:GntR family transcriptional regulator/MocR family aminotransferase